MSGLGGLGPRVHGRRQACLLSWEEGGPGLHAVGLRSQCLPGFLAALVFGVSPRDAWNRACDKGNISVASQVRTQILCRCCRGLMFLLRTKALWVQREQGTEREN